MIDEYWTFRFFGYTSDSLSNGSGKKVVVMCDKCGKYRAITFHQYRDLCSECAYMTDGRRKALSAAGRGRRPNDETRKRMSIAQTGRTHSDESKRKISLGNINKIMSDEAKEKIRNWHIGIKLSKKTIKKMSIARMGDKNPNWKGGASFEPYCNKFNNRFKESIREKFGRKCFLCQTTEEKNGEKLSVHHVSYKKDCLCDGVECEFIPLCRPCHARTNKNCWFWERLIIYALPYHEEERIIECIDILEMVTSNGKTCSWTALSCTILKRAGLNQKQETE